MTKQILKYVGITVLFSSAAIVIFWVGLQFWGDWHDEWSGYNARQYVSNGYCNIAVLPMFGEIISYPGANKNGLAVAEELPPTVNPDDVESFLHAAETDGNILGVLAEIDSTGGSGAAGISISNRMKQSSLPIAAVVRESAASAGYMIATGADTIIASPFSDVGSIGVTMSYLDNTEQNAFNGLSFVSLATGKFKDSGIPDKPLTAEERALFERDLQTWHDAFVLLVSENRNIPLEDVAKLADGSSMAAALALRYTLIDTIGDKETARAWFAAQLNLPLEEIVFCQ